MGVGTPADLLQCISLGIDMFDCVLPTRNARHGMIYTSEGIVNIKNSKWSNCFDPLDQASPLESSRVYSKAYVRHLFTVGEALGAPIASLQNLMFYRQLTADARSRICSGEFGTWKIAKLKEVTTRL